MSQERAGMHAIGALTSFLVLASSMSMLNGWAVTVLWRRCSSCWRSPGSSRSSCRCRDADPLLDAVQQAALALRDDPTARGSSRHPNKRQAHPGTGAVESGQADRVGVATNGSARHGRTAVAQRRRGHSDAAPVAPSTETAETIDAPSETIRARRGTTGGLGETIRG
jgi:hypothetical protein